MAGIIGWLNAAHSVRSVSTGLADTARMLIVMIVSVEMTNYGGIYETPIWIWSVVVDYPGTLSHLVAKQDFLCRRQVFPW